MAKLNSALEEVKYNIDNIVDFAISYFKNLKEKHGKGRERRTKKETFSEVKAKVISVPNQKLYVNRKDGFIGTSLKKKSLHSTVQNVTKLLFQERWKVHRIKSF